MTTDLLHAWLRRLAVSRLRDTWVVRGGLVTCHDCPERPAPQDVDVLALGAFDRAAVERAIREVTRARPADDDRVRFDDVATQTDVIWAETPFPGLRAQVPVRGANGVVSVMQIDIGFGDPLDPPPRKITIGRADVLAVRPETMIAWKVHGLVEHGRGRWRAKDLADAVLLARLPDLDTPALTRALRLAFESRATPLDTATEFFSDPTWGGSRGSRRKWKTFLMRRPCPLPEELAIVRNELRDRVGPIVASL